MSTKLAGSQVCPDLGSRGPRGPKLLVYECDKTTTHTICRDCMLHKPQSLSLHAKPVWNPVKLQGFIDSQRHIGEKREAMFQATFYPEESNGSKTSLANGRLSSRCVCLWLKVGLGIICNFFKSDFVCLDSDFYFLVILVESDTKPKHAESKNVFIFKAFFLQISGPISQRAFGRLHNAKHQTTVYMDRKRTLALIEGERLLPNSTLHTEKQRFLLCPPIWGRWGKMLAGFLLRGEVFFRGSELSCKNMRRSGRVKCEGS